MDSMRNGKRTGYVFGKALLVFFLCFFSMIFGSAPGKEPVYAAEQNSAEKSPVLLHPRARDSSVYRYPGGDGNSVSVSVRYPAVSLPEAEQQDCPELSRSLSAYNEQKETAYKSALNVLTQTASQLETQDYVSCQQQAELRVARSDSAAFSILERYSEYTGGVHGYYQTYGITWDTQTGELLSFPLFRYQICGLRSRGWASKSDTRDEGGLYVVGRIGETGDCRSV